MPDNNTPDDNTEIVQGTSDLSVADLSKLAIDQELLRSTTLLLNLNQELLVIHSDRIELCLNAHEQAQAGRHEWKGALGIFLTALAALVATDFKTFLGLSADVWQTGFIVITVLTGIWTVRSLYRTFANRNICTTGHLMNELKRRSIKEQ